MADLSAEWPSLFYGWGVFFYGTGSYPDPPQGLHRKMRFRASQPPLNGPYFFIASTAYCEHVGVYRQAAGVRGEMQCR